MRFVVSGSDKDTGLPIELTLEAVDVLSAAALASRKGIHVTDVHLVDGAVPPVMKRSVPFHYGANVPIEEQKAPASSNTPKTRFWLGIMLSTFVLVSPAFPAFGLIVGVALAAIIFLYLRVGPLQRPLGQFLRVSSDRPVRRVLKLTMFGFIAGIIISFSILGYIGQKAEDELAAKKAADEAARSLAETNANLQVFGLIDKAENALTAGNIDTAQEELDEALKINLATNRGQASRLQATINRSTDAPSALDALTRLTDADFDTFKTDSTPPKSFDLGYAILTNSFVATAKSQYDVAAAKRIEIRKQAAEKAEAQRVADAAQAVASKKAAEAKAAADAAAAAIARKTDAWLMAQKFIKDRLKAPSTASFGSFFGEYQNPDENVFIQDDGTYMVKIWVDSQNSFGAMLRIHFVLNLRYDGNDRWGLVDISSDE